MKKENENLSSDTLLLIHNSIHNGTKLVIIDNKFYVIEVASNKCRYLEYSGITFMEQNKNKKKWNSEKKKFYYSDYAKQAREGNKITWGIKPGKWIFIKNGVIN